MSDFTSARPPVFVDVDYAGETLTFVIVTTDKVVIGGVKSKSRSKIVEELQKGADPEATLQVHHALWESPTVIPLESIEQMHWHTDDQMLFFRYYDGTSLKAGTRGATMSSPEARTRAIESVENLVGPCDRTEESASVWHIGLQPIVYSIIVMISFGAFAIVGYLNHGKIDPDRIWKKIRILGDLLNWVGPTGMLLVGVGITMCLMLWWFIACLRPPLLHVSKPRRMPTSQIVN